MSPFCVLATSGIDGSVDASPRGGNPGFVTRGRTKPAVDAGPHRQQPDRQLPEHRRRHRLRAIGLLRYPESTRPSGSAAGARCRPSRILLASMEEFGKLPRAVLSISVNEAYFHCGKALMRVAPMVQGGAGRTLGDSRASARSSTSRRNWASRKPRPQSKRATRRSCNGARPRPRFETARVRSSRT